MFGQQGIPFQQHTWQLTLPSKHTVAADLTQDADFRLVNMFLVMLLLPCCSPCQRYWRFPAKTAHMTPTRTPCYGVSSTCWAFRKGSLSSTRQLHCIFNCNVQQLRPGRCHPPGAQADTSSWISGHQRASKMGSPVWVWSHAGTLPMVQGGWQLQQWTAPLVPLHRLWHWRCSAAMFMLGAVTAAVPVVLRWGTV